MECFRPEAMRYSYVRRWWWCSNDSDNGLTRGLKVLKIIDSNTNFKTNRFFIEEERNETLSWFLKAIVLV